MTSFHTFGESHADWGWNRIPGIKCHSTPSKLAYSVGRDGINVLNISRPEFEVNQGDSVMFIFGEIDCSCHVHKYIREDFTYKQVIETIVEMYVNTIKINAVLIPNLKIHICSITPAVEKGKVLFEQSDSGRTWLIHRFLGTDEERKTYVKHFNDCLREKCVENNYTFIDIHDKYCDGNGFLNRSLSCPSVHISDPVYIIEYLNENNILKIDTSAPQCPSCKSYHVIAENIENKTYRCVHNQDGRICNMYW